MMPEERVPCHRTHKSAGEMSRGEERDRGQRSLNFLLLKLRREWRRNRERPEKSPKGSINQTLGKEG